MAAHQQAMSTLLIAGQFKKQQLSSRPPVNNYISYFIQPRLEIVTQPVQRGYRFRYLSEGQSHGPLPGELDGNSSKVYPSVNIVNHNGPAQILLMLVSVDCNKIYLHPNSMIIDKEPIPRDFHLIEWTGRSQKFELKNVAIMQAKKNKRELTNLIKKRMTQTKYIRNFHEVQNGEFTAEDLINQLNAIEVVNTTEADNEAMDLAKKINLDTCRLCFQAFLPDANKKFTIALAPVYSQKIYNKASPIGSDLKILKLSTAASVVTGDEEVWMMTVSQFDSKTMDICFFEDDGNPNWRPIVANLETHKKFLVIFKTPAYHDLTITQPVSVKLQIKRRDDGSVSQPMPFTYNPKNTDPYGIEEKRKKRLQFPVDFEDQEQPAKRFRPDDPPLPSFDTIGSNSFAELVLQQQQLQQNQQFYQQQLQQAQSTSSTNVEHAQVDNTAYPFDYSQLQGFNENILMGMFSNYLRAQENASQTND